MTQDETTDRVQIQYTMAVYCNSVDSGDVEGVDRLFAAGDAWEESRGGFGFADAFALMGDVVGVSDDGVFDFEAGGCGADVEDLWHGGHEFVELEGAVVEGGGEAEAVLD